ncbi:MAG: hypothetical protein JWM78_2951 [Verrucomicrobiaceae bacterium]|nr:hypothetical protein [Verrucomicrobiaceae bacterium]
MQTIEASIGTWYEDLRFGTQFEVVTLDEAEQTVEIQMLDGEICEYDFDSWREMTLLSIAQPEDARKLNNEHTRRSSDTPSDASELNSFDDDEPDILSDHNDNF